MSGPKPLEKCSGRPNTILLWGTGQIKKPPKLAKSILNTAPVTLQGDSQYKRGDCIYINIYVHIMRAHIHTHTLLLSLLQLSPLQCGNITSQTAAKKFHFLHAALSQSIKGVLESRSVRESMKERLKYSQYSLQRVPYLSL